MASGEARTCDFSKYDDVLVTGGGTGVAADSNLIKTWDLRNVKLPMAVYPLHRYAVKRVRCSPWNASHILSCSEYYYNANPPLETCLYAYSTPRKSTP